MVKIDKNIVWSNARFKSSSATSIIFYYKNQNSENFETFFLVFYKNDFSYTSFYEVRPFLIILNSLYIVKLNSFLKLFKKFTKENKFEIKYYFNKFIYCWEVLKFYSCNFCVRVNRRNNSSILYLFALKNIFRIIILRLKPSLVIDIKFALKTNLF